MIESVNNERIKRFSKLQNKKYRDLEGFFIVEGEHLVEEAKKKNLLVEVFSLDGSDGTIVSEAVMRKLSGLKSVPKVLGIAKKPENTQIKGNILMLDGIQDPGNLGTIIRSAVAFNIDTIVASLDTVDVYNTKTLRSSEGMIFNINYVTADLENIIKNLKDYNVYVTNVLNGESLDDIETKGNYALIVGNEGSGVRKNIQELATNTLYIPMNDKCESLNVAIATSIILYELNK
ncbi:MAG: RNA methyltransferase [Bacilli bacterium]|mgnify:FL=1|jgi:TrmH family RNA methyltransferase|nr:RNA methyltransferase [Bacilli bacterium]